MSTSKPPRRRRGYGLPPRRTKNPWASGVYAAVLLVVLLLVLLFNRYFAAGVADAVLTIADVPTPTPVRVVESPFAEEVILEARNQLFNAIYRAQRTALEASIPADAAL